MTVTSRLAYVSTWWQESSVFLGHLHEAAAALRDALELNYNDTYFSKCEL